ncbi:tRNA threonylcarbamoyladenosine biosynthesis protein TsaE [Sporomusa carbonis]|uniref:tRNA (adenosine(37)-N6)-threonylcarbamoyltransferase complex ATPase subunit type 1 TsaE n=1 Tax=Sporomusa carbonis TaxID=3076075 RepID=UPI003A6C6433
MLVFKTASPDETYELGQEVARVLKPGDVLCLSGNLGTGKTLLTQGIAAGLNVTDAVASPTFTVLNVYQGMADGGQELSIYHFDLYRLEHPAELADIGFDHYIGAGGVAIIEWPEKFLEFLPEERLWLTLKPGDSPSERVICLKDEGARYREICEELKQFAHSCYRYSNPCV